MVERRINRRQQGDLGEASALEWLTAQGATVFLPFGHSPDIDLIAQFGGSLTRVQVKTSVCRVTTPSGLGRWSVLISTRGGNRSWSGTAKLLDPELIDFVFALVGDGRRWFIPVDEIEARSCVQLGGPKYSEFEIGSAPDLENTVYGTVPAAPTITAALGGVSKRSTDGDCKSSGSAFAGSNPASPIPSAAERSERTPTGQTRVSGNRQIVIPKRAFEEAELQRGDRLKAVARRPGEVTFQRIGPRYDEGPRPSGPSGCSSPFES
jgi:hypothetical protein